MADCYVIPAPYQLRDKLQRESRTNGIKTLIPAFAGMTSLFDALFLYRFQTAN